MGASRPDVATLNEFINAAFEHNTAVIEQAGNMTSRVRQPVAADHLRPGGTVSGPVLFAVADRAMYVAILAEIGLVPLAVTTDMTIHFMRKPDGRRDILGECRLLKLGKRLAVGEIHLYSDGTEAPVAHATGTYSIPPREDTTR